MENKDHSKSSGDTRSKHDADSGNDSSNELLQKEKLIDPGNEHSHHTGHERDSAADTKHDADSGGDGTGTVGSKQE